VGIAQKLERHQCDNDKWGFRDKNKNLVIACKYDWVGIFSEGLAAVKLNDKYGFIDTKNELIIPYKYDDVWW